MASATASTIAAVASMPVFAASTPMSVATARIWAATIAGRDASVVGDALGVLDGDGGDGGHAEHAERGERLQVGLDAGAAAGVAAGDRERAGTRCAWRRSSGGSDPIPAGSSGRSAPVGSTADQALAVDDLADGGERRAVPPRGARAAATSRTSRPRQRGEQLVVLAARRSGVPRAGGARSATGTSPRRTARADAARDAEPAEVHREPVGHVHHRRGAVAREHRALAHASHRAQRARASSARSAGSATARAPALARRAGRPPTAPSAPVTAIGSPGTRARPRHRAARRDLAGHRDGDRDRVGARQIPADEPERVLVAGLPHPAVQLDHPGGVDVGRQRERHQRGRGLAPIAAMSLTFTAMALYAEVARRGRSRGRSARPRPARRRSARARRPRREDGRVVAGTDDDLRPGARQHACGSRRQLVLAQLHPRSVPGKRPRAIRCADGPDGRPGDFARL